MVTWREISLLLSLTCIDEKMESFCDPEKRMFGSEDQAYLKSLKSIRCPSCAIDSQDFAAGMLTTK